MSSQPIPVGAALLGHVLNSHGELIDHKDRLAYASLRPLYEPGTQRTRVDVSSMGVLETGIKMLDLLAPASHGGVIGMMAGAALGLVVVAEELMSNLITHQQAVHRSNLSRFRHLSRLQKEEICRARVDLLPVRCRRSRGSAHLV